MLKYLLLIAGMIFMMPAMARQSGCIVVDAKTPQQSVGNVGEIHHAMAGSSKDSIPLVVPNYWFNAGLGGSSMGISAGLGTYYQKAHKLYGLRYSYNEEFNILGPLPTETVWDFGPMIGWIAKNQHGFFSLAGGGAVVGGVKRGNYIISSGWFNSYYERKTFLTIGIPMEVQLTWTPLKFLGIGFSGFGNVNSDRSFWGLMFNLSLGHLK